MGRPRRVGTVGMIAMRGPASVRVTSSRGPRPRPRQRPCRTVGPVHPPWTTPATSANRSLSRSVSVSSARASAAWRMNSDTDSPLIAAAR